MPTVPKYEQQVSQQATPDVRLPTSTPSGAFGLGPQSQQARSEVLNTTSKVQKMFDEEKKKADDVAFMSADLQASKAQTDIEVGIRARKGEDAFSSSKWAEQEWKDKTSEIYERANNSAQRARIQRSLNQRAAGIYKAAQVHQQNEIVNYTKEQTQAYVEAERASAVENYQDPAKVGTSLERQKAALSQILSNLGVSKDSPAGKQVFEEAVSQTHSQVINRMLADGNDQQARAYFKANKKDISTKFYDKLKSSLEEGSLRGESQRRSDAIVAKADGMGDALDKARAITDPKLRDETQARVKNYYALESAAHEEDQKNIFERSSRIIDDAEYPTKDMIPPADWNELDAKRRKALLSRIKAKAEGLPIRTNLKDYQALSKMAQDNRTAFLKEDILKYQLSEADAKKWLDRQKAAKEGNTKLLDGFLSDKQVASQLLRDVGIDPKKKNQADTVALFERKLDELAQQFAEENGRRPTNRELRGIAEPLLIEGTVDGFLFFNDDKRAFELEEGEAFETITIPDGERPKIIEALRAMGMKATDENISDLYIRTKVGK